MSVPQSIRDQVKTRVAVMSPDEVERLCRENPQHHETYKFTYDDPGRVLPMTEVAALVQRIKAACAAARVATPDADDDEIAAGLLASDAAVEHFAKVSHPRIFKLVTNRHAPAAALSALELMLSTKAKIEAGAVDEVAAIKGMQETLLASCTTKQEE